MMRPYVVALEGIDGSGTTTQTEAVSAYLASQGYFVFKTKQPSIAPIGKLIRDYLSGRLPPIPSDAMALLYAADRVAMAPTEKAQEVDIIISDRSWVSSLAYQRKETARALAAWPGLLPDLYILLYITPKVAAARMESRELKDLYEKNETIQEQAFARYDKISKQAANWKIVDGTMETEEVTKIIGETVISELLKRSIGG